VTHATTRATASPSLIDIPKRPGRRTRSVSNGWFGWMLAGPYAVLLAVFAIGPLGYAVYESLQPSTTPGGNDNAFVAAFADFRLLPAAINVGTFLIIYLPVMVIGVVILALILDVQPRRFGAMVRLIYVLPGVITGSASVLLWYLMLEPQTSPFAPILNAMGMHSDNDIFQNSRLPVIFAMMAFATGFGQWTVVLYGSLQSISPDILEAARIDGASGWQTALRIKLPLIGKYITYMLVLCFASALQIFVEPAILSGLASVGSTTWSLNQLSLFFAFNNGDFSTSAALSLALLVVCVGVAVLLVRKGNLFETEVIE
jgi:multiple sugar transport system permease protein